MISKVVRRSLFKSKFLLFSVFLLFTISTMFLTVALVAFNNLEDSKNELQQNSNQENFRFYGVSQLSNQYNQKFINKFDKEQNTKIERKDYSIYKSNKRTYAINDYQPSDKIDQPQIVEGSLPTQKNEIVITPNSLTDLNKSVGDKVKFKGNTYTISGTAYFVEYTFPIDIPTQTIGLGDSNFLPVYMNHSSYEDLNIGEQYIYMAGTWNSIPSDIQKALKDMQDEYYYNVPVTSANGTPEINPTTGKLVTQRIDLVSSTLQSDSNLGISAINEEIKGDRTSFTVLSIVIIIIAAVMTIILFSSIFKSQKREMGILKAEGVTQGALSFGFSIYLVGVVLLSSVIGIFLGYFLSGGFDNLILKYYYFSVSSISASTIVRAILIILVVDIIISLLIYYFSIYKNLKTKPLLLIKNISTEKTPKYKFGFITNHLNFFNKYRFNILVRNWGTVILLAFGVFVSSFLLLFGGLAFTSINSVINDTYSQVFTYDYEVSYSPGYSPKFNDNSIAQVNTNIEDISTENDVDNTDTVNLYAFDSKNNSYINLTDDKNKSIPSSKFENGVVVSSVIADTYNLESGDTITVDSPYDKDKTVKFKVDGVTDEGVTKNVYMDINEFQNKFDLPNNYSNGSVGEGNKEKQIKKEDSKAIYTPIKKQQAQLDDITNTAYIMVGFITLISIMISFISLVIISFIVINKNKKVISMMKVLGYTNKEITKIVTSGYKWIVIVVYFISIPLFQYLIQALINEAFKDSSIHLNISMNWISVIVGFIIIYIIYLLASYLSRRKVNKIKLSESLKIDE